MSQSTPGADVEYKVIDVTSNLAAQWLTHNRRNRNLSPTTVAKYRRDMQTGRWQFAADPIRFDPDGNLLDGQHRLTALAECGPGTTIPMLVVYGLATATQLIMDQGKKRRPGEQLSLLGVKDSNIVAAGIRLYLAHQSGLMFRDTHVQQVEITTAEMEQWYALHTDLVSLASSVGHLRASDAPPSVDYCAVLLFINAMGYDQTQEFFRLLAVGAGEGHAINALDKRLQRIRREKLRASQRDYLALFIQAANAWREQRIVSKFQMPRGAKWTKDTFPQLRDNLQEASA